MAEENLVPSSDHPIRIRWLNAAEQNPTIQRPTAPHVSTPMIKTNKLTAPSVVNKTRTKTGSATNIVRFIDPPSLTDSIHVTVPAASKGIKELSAEDKLKIANLIKELARLGHEKERVESQLEQERKVFEVQTKTLLTDYERLMKENQKLLSRYNETKTILNEYEKRPTSAFQSVANEFPNPRRSSTPIDLPAMEPASNRPKPDIESIPSARTASFLLNEQFQLKQSMMEKQLELLHKQQQLLERELHQRNTVQLVEKAPMSPVIAPSAAIHTTSRATSPMKQVSKPAVMERATSTVKHVLTKQEPADMSMKRTTGPRPVHYSTKRQIQTQRYDLDNDEEDLLILSLNESLHDVKGTPTRSSQAMPTASLDADEQDLLKDIFFIC